MPSNHLILCGPLLLLPSIFPSIRVFFSESVFASGGQSIAASAPVLPMNLQGWFPLGLTGLIFLHSKGPSRVFSSTTIQKHQFFGAQPSLWSNSHICMWILEKTMTVWTFVSKVVSLLFNMLSRFKITFSSMEQFSSVAQLCPTLCDPMNHSTPGLPVHHQLPEFTQTHVHRVGDAIQLSHPLLSPSPPAPNPSQHQGLLQWIGSSYEVAKNKVLELQL